MWDKDFKIDLTELHSNHSMEILEKLTKDNKKGSHKRTSEGGCQDYDQSLFYTKQINRNAEAFQISFQKGFMDQYKANFQKSYENYMEAMNQIKQNLQQYHQKQALVDSGLKVCQFYREILMEQQFQLCLQEVAKIHQQVSKHEKIPQFLDFVCVTIRKKLAVELMKFTAEVLIKSSNFLNEIQSSLEFISKGNQLAEYLINHPSLGATLRPINARILPAYFEFLSIFSSTVLLVASQYFQNPYYMEKSRQNNPKRFLNISQDSQSEQSFEITPKKLRKCSF